MKKPLFLSLFLVSPPALASDFVDTWITFAFSDDNVLAGSIDGSPAASFFQIEDETFFENYETVRTGDETQSHLALYRKFPSFFPRLATEAALVFEFNVYADPETGEQKSYFNDDGSYIRLFWSPGEGRKRDLSLVVFPYNSWRMWLGYSYDISWGGEEIFPRNEHPVPGMKIQFETGRGYAYMGAKTARILNEDTNEQETAFGLLGGAGLSLSGGLKAEGGGGFFTRGVFPTGGGDVMGTPIYAAGLSGQISYEKGLPFSRWRDYLLYRNTPDFVFEIFEPEQYDPAGGVSIYAATEASYLFQNLIDPEDGSSTVLQPALAADLNLKFKWKYWRLTFDTVYRDLAFILFNVPGFVPYEEFARDSSVTPEVFFATGIDRHFPGLHLTPALIFGYQMPATYSYPQASEDFPALGLTGKNTIVVRSAGDFDILPPGEGAFDILVLKSTCRLDFSRYIFFLAEATYTLDKNATRYVRSEDGTTYERVFESPNVTNKLGFAMILTARF